MTERLNWTFTIWLNPLKSCLLEKFVQDYRTGKYWEFDLNLWTPISMSSYHTTLPLSWIRDWCLWPNAGDIRDAGSIPGSGRFPGGRHGNPLQYSCLENPMDRAVWQPAVHRVAQRGMQLNGLSTHTYARTFGQNPKTHTWKLTKFFFPIQYIHFEIFLFFKAKWSKPKHTASTYRNDGLNWQY